MTTNDRDTLRRSIEVEYWVIDGDGELTRPGPLVEASPGVEREFVEPLLEIKTTPCETTAELREELFDRITAVLQLADELGLGLVPLATPMNAGAIPDHLDERTWIQDRIVDEKFEYVRHCAGTHIHFEQQPGRETDQLNLLTALDPALALVNAGSHFRGSYVAAGARSKLYRRLAYEDLPHQGRLWPYADSTDGWHRRTERRYDELLAAAVEAGIDRELVEKHFDPESAVWIPVKLREQFSTVEWRAPDTALPSQVIRLADDLAGVVESLDGREVEIGGSGRVTPNRLLLPEFETLCQYVDDAIDVGLSSPVVSYLDRMGFEVEAYDPITGSLPTGPVSETAARQLRLDYAEQLEQDVRMANPIYSD